jgi:hypothetical protein
MILKFNSISEIAVNISKVLPHGIRRVLFYLYRPSDLKFWVYFNGVVVNVSNLKGILRAVFFHCKFNLKSREIKSAKHGTKILNLFMLPEV